jgi:predicted nucleic acid-binding protein
MAIKVFLDTNIILDLLDSKRRYHEPSKHLFRGIENRKLKAFVSESVICNTDYILQTLWPKSERNQFFEALFNTISVLPCKTTTIQNALQIPLPDLEDAILFQIALENSIDFLVSNDKQLTKFDKNGVLKTISTEGILAHLG